MRLLHTMLRVNNLQESLQFYCDVLGMKLLRQKDYPNGNNPKKLLVNNDNWPIVVSVAVALKRADVPFYVHS